MFGKNSVVFCLLMLLFVSACSEQATEPQGDAEKPVTHEMKVIVPESVAGKWKSVKVALRDQETGAEEVYRVAIGGSFQIPETSMRVTVESFMPAFSANSERATSVSNKPTNPAVQIVVRDGDRELHRGWVFGLYPDRHQFEDSRYKFILLDYQPER